MSRPTHPTLDALCAKKTPIFPAAAVMTRFGNERGLVGALQELQRGS